MGRHIHINRRWDCTRVYGTPTIGRQEEGWWKRTGPKPPSRLPSGTTIPMDVCGPAQRRFAAWTRLRGCRRRLIPATREFCDGFRRNIWFMIIVLIKRDSLKAFLGSALSPPSHRVQDYHQQILSSLPVPLFIFSFPICVRTSFEVIK